VLSPIGGLLVEDLLIHAADPSILLASVSYEAPGLYRSTDSGATWTHILEIPNVGDLTTHPATPEIILAGTGTGVMRSMDGGVHWSPAVSLPFSNLENFPGVIGDESYVVSFAPSDPNRAYATRGDPSKSFHTQTIQMSTDAGATFRDVSGWLRNVKAFAVYPSNPNVLCAGAIVYPSGEVLVSRSTDSGLTWTTVYVSPSSAQPTDLQFDLADPNHLYFTQGYSQSGGGIAHSNAGGAPGSWTTSVNGISNFPVYQLGGDLIGTNFVHQDSRLYRSFGDLSTWTLLPSIGIEFLSACFEVPAVSPGPADLGLRRCDTR
jgi:hypothetical protein